jgi:hypothetical protein
MLGSKSLIIFTLAAVAFIELIRVAFSGNKFDNQG